MIFVRSHENHVQGGRDKMRKRCGQPSPQSVQPPKMSGVHICSQRSKIQKSSSHVWTGETRNGKYSERVYSAGMGVAELD